MTTRLSTRPKLPDINKPLKIIESYEDFAQFEVGSFDLTNQTSTENEINKKIEELKSDFEKTSVALKQKQAVRIPEIISKSLDSNIPEFGKISAEIQEKPLLKRKFNRTSHFIRYFGKLPWEDDTKYNYEATNEDLLFLTELAGSPFTVQEFEKLINFFEKENNDDESVKSYEFFRAQILALNMKQSLEDISKIYDYWKDARNFKHGGKGLLRKYWKPPDPMNPNPKVCFRKNKEEKRNLRRARKYDYEFFQKVFFIIIKHTSK